MRKILSLLAVLGLPALTFASEADLVIPSGIKSQNILYWGFLIIFLGFLFGFYQFVKVQKLRTQLSSLPIKFNA